MGTILLQKTIVFRRSFAEYMGIIRGQETIRDIVLVEWRVETKRRMTNLTLLKVWDWEKRSGDGRSGEWFGVTGV